MIFGGKDRKRIEELSREREELLLKIAQLERQNSAIQAMLSGMVEGVIAVDKDTRILSVNASIEDIFGIKKDEAQGRYLLEVIRNNDIAEVINKTFSAKGVVSEEISLSWPVQRVFQVNASPILEGNQISGCMIVIHDITELRKLEKVRTDFVANVSPELKTPLTSIKGFVETLLDGALEDKEHGRGFLKIIENHTERLNRLINDLLDLSQIEAKEIKLDKERIVLGQLVEKTITGFRSQIKKGGIDVENRISPEVVVTADKARMEQVLTNLIDNSIKFNKERGYIKIYTLPHDNKIKVVIEDSGQGIPEKDLPRIFERFYRVDKARSRELGGTGLGLSIVKHIVELHGGSVGVESTEGLGSKFYFTLPK
jgi:two-component system phosphate regulon sensor histidine kinase PhoR